MIVIMTAKKLKKICDAHYNRGVAKGYELGYLMGRTGKMNRGFGSKVDEQIQELLRKSEFGK